MQALAVLGHQAVRLFRVGALGFVSGLCALTAANAALPSQFDRLTDAILGPLVAPGSDEPSPPSPFAYASPLPGRPIDSPFGLRRMPWEAEGRLHEGVDIAAPLGEPVRAAAPGVVARIDDGAGYGRFIEVQHAGGLVSTYAHLEGAAAGLQPGSPVQTGDVIGFVGSTGRSTGPHLHFELRKDGAPLDPAQFIGRSFAGPADLPVTRAEQYSPVVRIAAASGPFVAAMRARISAAGLRR